MIKPSGCLYACTDALFVIVGKCSRMGSEALHAAAAAMVSQKGGLGVNISLVAR